MNRQTRIKPLYVALLLLVCLPAWAAADKFFRYRNHSGLTIIDSRMPPEYVDYGYEIINDHGQVLSTVAPRATEADIAANRERQRKLRLQQKQQKADEMLLTRYSAVTDIKAAEQRVTDEINMRVTILRSNMRSIRRQMERQREVAANEERSGRPVPQKLQDNIAGMEAEIAGLLEKIDIRKGEVVEQQAKFQQQVDRFQYLQDRRYGRNTESADAEQQELAAEADQ